MAVLDHGVALARVKADVPADVAFEILQREGVLVIENALSTDLLEGLKDDLDPWFDAACHGAGAFFGKQTRRFGGLFAKASSSAHLAIHPLVLDLMERTLKGPAEAPVCDAIELNLTQAIGIEPGEPAQFLHRDEELWPFARSFEVMANAMWALDDFTLENGATRLIPGSHRWSRDRQPVPGDAISATAPAGSVILWLGGVLHAGGANASDRIRRGVVMSYKLAWLTGGERLLLTTPPEIARTLPERLQRLLGYQLHRPNLGWIEGRDPIQWLRGEFDQIAPMEDNLAPEHEELLAAATADPDAFAGYLS
jgi:ectoine hydroxylase-related dioxygenase (phytanoyl-CoA dioxygenase family)